MSLSGSRPSTAAGDRVTRWRGRTAWIELLEQAAAIGERAADGQALAKSEAITFAGQVIRTTAQPFPLPFESARAAAAGFREIARGFVAAAQPELIAALGQAMAGAANCCRRIIQLDDDQQSAAWRRRIGED